MYPVDNSGVINRNYSRSSIQSFDHIELLEVTLLEIGVIASGIEYLDRYAPLIEEIDRAVYF